MAKQILTDLDLNGNQIINSTAEKLTAAPSSPALDQHYFNTTDNKEYYWNGTAWVEVGGGGGSSADKLPLAGGTMTGTIAFKKDVDSPIAMESDDGKLALLGCKATGGTGASMYLYGATSAETGTVQLNSNSATSSASVRLEADGKFQKDAPGGNTYDILDSSNITDNLSSESTTNVLSAKQGKVLYDGKSKVTVSDTGTSTTQLPKYMKIKTGDTEVEYLTQSIQLGRYLSEWNCVTGKPVTNPGTLPFAYAAGDYYVVSVIDTAATPTNYIPTGATYDGTASTVVATGTVAIGNIFRYNGTAWILDTSVKPITFKEISGQPSDNNKLKTALDEKLAQVSGATTNSQVYGKKADGTQTMNDIVTSFSSTSTDEQIPTALATYTANAALYTRINNISTLGRYLSEWNCITGKPLTDPTTLPYNYLTGDYYIVSNVDTSSSPTNFMPNGSSYDGTASTTPATTTVAIGNVYRYDGSVWTLETTSTVIAFKQISGEPSDNVNLSKVLNSKLAKVEGATTSKQVYSKAADGTQSMSDVSTAISATSTDEQVASAKSVYTAAKPIIDTNTTTYYIKQVINGNNCSIELSSTAIADADECFASQFALDATNCKIVLTGATIDAGATIEVIDSLTSTSATAALSAKQGKILNESKSKVTVSATGTSTTALPEYMTIDNTEYKVAAEPAEYIKSAEKSVDGNTLTLKDKAGTSTTYKPAMETSIVSTSTNDKYAGAKAVYDVVSAKLDKSTGATTNKQVYSKKTDGSQEMSDITTAVGTASTDDQIASAKAVYDATKPIVDTHTTVYYAKQIINGNNCSLELSSTAIAGYDECFVSQFEIGTTDCKIVFGGATIESTIVTKESLGLGNVTNDAQVKRSEMGVANGVATLDSSGRVPSSELPSYVDDVLEYDKKDDFPTTGESGKIYIALDTNKTYRWGGTVYVEISASLALGETATTAYYGDKGKTAYDHSQVTTGNPHRVTKSDVSLGNVDNYSTATSISSASTDTSFVTPKAVYSATKAVVDTRTTVYYAKQVVNGNNCSLELSSTPIADADECLVAQFDEGTTDCKITLLGAEAELSKGSIGLDKVDNFPTATTISASSTNTNFVTPKAVYDYIQSLDANETSY